MTQHTDAAAPLPTEHFELGEGIHEDAFGTVRWVDISRGLVMEGTFDGALHERRRLHFDSTVGVCLPTEDGGLIAATGHGVTTISTKSHRSSPLAVLDPNVSRFNDGICDPQGRFIAGSVSLTEASGREAIYRIEHDGSTTVLASGLTLANGIGFSPTGDTMYYVDSIPGIVWSRPYHFAGSTTSSSRIAFEISDGTPDGLRVDTAGMLWIAIWGEGQVRSYQPDGRLLHTIDVDAPHVSSTGFLSSQPGTMLITTARHGLDDEALTSAPRSGQVFVADVAAEGIPITAWKGSTRTPPWSPRTS